MPIRLKLYEYLKYGGLCILNHHPSEYLWSITKGMLSQQAQLWLTTMDNGDATRGVLLFTTRIM